MICQYKLPKNLFYDILLSKKYLSQRVHLRYMTIYISFRLWQYQQWGCSWALCHEQLSYCHHFVCQQLLWQRAEEISVFLELDLVPKQPNVLLQASPASVWWRSEPTEYDTYGGNFPLSHNFPKHWWVYLLINKMKSNYMYPR